MPNFNNPRTVYPKNAIQPGWIDVPVLGVQVADDDCWFIAMYLSNTTASPITLTITDGDGHSPFAAVEIAGNTTYAVEFIYGSFFKGGMLAIASGAGLQGDFIITVKP